MKGVFPMPSQVTILIAVAAVMFFVIGGLSLLAHYYTLSGIKSKTVGDGQHGTARFATENEIKRTYTHDKDMRGQFSSDILIEGIKINIRLIYLINKNQSRKFPFSYCIEKDTCLCLNAVFGRDQQNSAIQYIQ